MGPKYLNGYFDGDFHLEVYRRKVIRVEGLFFVEALPALASVMSGQVVIPPGR